MVLIKKMAIFSSLFFRQYRPGKCVLQYSRKPLFPSRISMKIYFKAYFFRKPKMEKFIIFDQHRGLTPFEKFKICNIWPKSWSWKFNFFVNFLKSFFYKRRKPFFPCFLKNLQWKISNFWRKSLTFPFRVG